MTAPPGTDRRAFVATCAGAALSAAAFGLYARVEWPWFLLGWVGLIPWLVSLDRVASLRRAVLSGWLMSVAFVAAVFWWFVVGVGEYTGSGPLIAAVVIAAVAPLLQPQFVAVAIVRHLGNRAGGFWLPALAVALTYCGTEWAIPKLFGDTIGHGFYASRHLRQAADLAGASGLTCLLILVNQCVLEVAHRIRGGMTLRALAPAFVPVAVVVSLYGYGAMRLRQLDSRDIGSESLAAGIVQANISNYARLASEMGTFDAARNILDAHFELSAAALAAGDVDLLVWPETVYPTTFGAPKSEAGAELDKEIAAFVVRTGVPLVFGAYDVDGAEEYNAAMFLEPRDGKVALEAYRKGSLFPLTERVPWPLDTAPVRAWFPWLGTWKAGDPPRSIELRLASGRNIRVAPLICYDAVDPARTIAAVRQGADVIVTLSNDSWFSAGGGPRLHLVVSAFRSLETRRAQIRATNTGISAFITAAGDTVSPVAVNQRAAVVTRLPLAANDSTLMLAWGDWFGPVSSLLAVGWAIVCGGRFLLTRSSPAC